MKTKLIKFLAVFFLLVNAIAVKSQVYIFSQGSDLGSSDGAGVLGPRYGISYFTKKIDEPVEYYTDAQVSYIPPQPDDLIFYYESLGKTRNPKVVSVIAKGVKNESQQVRMAVVKVLGTFNTPESISALITALDDEDIYVAEEAALHLGELKAKSAVPALIKLGKRLYPQQKEQPEQQMLEFVSNALGEIGVKSAGTFLWKIFNDDWGEEQQGYCTRECIVGPAAVNLAKIGDTQIAVEIKKRFKNEPLLYYIIAMRILKNPGINKEVIEIIQDSVDNGSSLQELPTMAEGCLLLGETKETSAIPLLKKLVKQWKNVQPSDGVFYPYGRFRVLWPHVYPAFALALIGDPEGEKTLQWGLDQNEEIEGDFVFLHYVSGLLLYELGHKDVLPKLVQEMSVINARTKIVDWGPAGGDSTHELRNALVEDMVNDLGQDATPYLVDLANDYNMYVSNPVKYLLYNKMPPEQVISLAEKKVSEGKTQAIKDTYAEVLLFMGEPAEPALIRLTKEGNFWTRAAGVLALISLDIDTAKNLAKNFRNDFEAEAKKYENVLDDVEKNWEMHSTWKWIKTKMETVDKVIKK